METVLGVLYCTKMAYGCGIGGSFFLNMGFVGFLHLHCISILYCMSFVHNVLPLPS
jgi:hypothetical protein